LRKNSKRVAIVAAFFFLLINGLTDTSGIIPIETDTTTTVAATITNTTNTVTAAAETAVAETGISGTAVAVVATAKDNVQTFTCLFFDYNCDEPPPEPPQPTTGPGGGTSSSGTFSVNASVKASNATCDGCLDDSGTCRLENQTINNSDGVEGFCCSQEFKPSTQICGSDQNCSLVNNSCERPKCSDSSTCQASCGAVLECDGSTCSKQSQDYLQYCLQSDEAAACGDGVCNFNENNSTCPSDCNFTNAAPPRFTPSESYASPQGFTIGQPASFVLRYNTSYPIKPESAKCTTVPEGVNCSCNTNHPYVECTVSKLVPGTYIFAAENTIGQPLAMRVSVDNQGRVTMSEETAGAITNSLLIYLAIGLTILIVFAAYPVVDFELNKRKRLEQRLAQKKKEYTQAMRNYAQGHMNGEQFQAFEIELLKETQQIKKELYKLKK
jgi:hypothetical protein